MFEALPSAEEPSTPSSAEELRELAQQPEGLMDIEQIATENDMADDWPDDTQLAEVRTQKLEKRQGKEEQVASSAYAAPHQAGLHVVLAGRHAVAGRHVVVAGRNFVVAGWHEGAGKPRCEPRGLSKVATVIRQIRRDYPGLAVS